MIRLVMIQHLGHPKSKLQFCYYCKNCSFTILIHFYNVWKSKDLLLLGRLKNRLDSAEQKVVQFSLEKIFWLCESGEINKDLLWKKYTKFVQVQDLFFRPSELDQYKCLELLQNTNGHFVQFTWTLKHCYKVL